MRRYSYRKWPAIPSGRDVDNVQIAFNVLPPEKKGWYLYPPGTMPRFMCYKTTDYEYAFNPGGAAIRRGHGDLAAGGAGVPRKHFFPRQPKAAVDGGPVTDGKLAMRRDGNTPHRGGRHPLVGDPRGEELLDAGQPSSSLSA